VVSGDPHDVGIAVVIGPAGDTAGGIGRPAGVCAVIGAVAILPVRRAR
jgi:hypothetical protein